MNNIKVGKYYKITGDRCKKYGDVIHITDYTESIPQSAIHNCGYYFKLVKGTDTSENPKRNKWFTINSDIAKDIVEINYEPKTERKMNELDKLLQQEENKTKNKYSPPPKYATKVGDLRDNSFEVRKEKSEFDEYLEYEYNKKNNFYGHNDYSGGGRSTLGLKRRTKRVGFVSQKVKSSYNK